jgi:tetratricopeptide (TPR) repeat protein
MRYLLCLVVLIFISACSAPQTRVLHQQLATLKQRPNIDLQSVPFFAQDTHQCGPAALATMLQNTGVNIVPEQLVPEIYVPARQGSFAIEMMASARQHGRLTYPLAANLSAIFAALDGGQPVLVLQNNGLSIYPVWHFAVIVGVDYPHEQLILRSGREQRLVLPFSTFEHTWARGKYWATLILDPAHLPAWLEADKALYQLSILEKHGSVSAAQAGYQQATQHWPNEKAAWLGLGNSSVTLGESAKGEAAFHELIRRFPGDGAGLNNLADLLLRQGRAQEALPFAEQAAKVLAIPATQETLAAVKAALAK